MTDDEIATFWELARFHAKLNVAPAYFGPTTLEVVRPPAWSFGETPEEADEFVAGLDDDERERLRLECHAQLGPGPFEVTGDAWAVRAVVRPTS